MNTSKVIKQGVCALLTTMTASLAAMPASAQVPTDNCAEKSTQLLAHYTRSWQPDHATDAHNKPVQTQLQLWRQGNRVALHDTASAITEVWFNGANNKLHLVRYFHKQQRGIEYYAADLLNNKKARDWSYLSQLVSDDAIAAMQQQGRDEAAACKTLVSYTQQHQQGRLDLHWLQQLRLIQRYSFPQANGRGELALDEVAFDAARVAQFFQRLDSWETTDYADIGDNESDPFLAQMINQGFIEHGASGFYNADGQALQGEHKH